jgi:hypothetical protein
MCTIGKSIIYKVGTVAEIQKYFSLMAEEKDSESL